MPENSFQHPEWEVVPDRHGEAELSLDALRSAFAKTFAPDSQKPRERSPEELPPSESTSPSSDSQNTSFSLNTQNLQNASSAFNSQNTEALLDSSEGSADPNAKTGTSNTGAESATDSTILSDAASFMESSMDTTNSADDLEDSESEQRRLNPLTILEAMLFTGGPGGRSLTAACVCRSMRGVTADEIPHYVARLNAKYVESGRTFEIVLSGDGYRLSLRSEYASIRSLFQGRVREARLSQAAVQVLAIVAWRQPITAEEVLSLRDGASSQSLLSQLVRRRLLQIERPAGERTAVYRTTERFLELFHINSLADLPQSDDF